MTNVLRGLAGATVDGSRLALPAGAGDTLAAVSDGALYKQLASAYLGSAPLRVLPEDYRYHSESADSVAVGSITIFHSNNNCCGYAAQELVRNQDGSGSWFDGQARHAGTWDQDGVFKLTTPRIRAEQRLRNNRYEVLEVALEQVRVRRQWGNARLGFATITEIGHEYQNGAVVPDSFYSGSFGFTYNNWTLLSAPGNISGAVVAGLPQLSATVTLSSQVVMQFNADGSASTLADRGRSAVAHTWKFRDGKLVLDNGTGMTAELVKSSGSNSGEHWLARIHDNGVVRPYSLGVFRNVKAGLAFTDSSALGRWESASSIIGFGPHDVVDVLANYISADVTVPYTPVPTAWWVSNGVLVMTSQDPREYRGYPDCQEGFICPMFKERAWTLLAQEENAIIVMEKRTTVTNDHYPAQYRVIRYIK
jgi:hypothetical protein